MIWKGEKSIFRQKVDGSSLEVVVNVEAPYVRMATDAQYVYWTELGASGSVLRADLKSLPAEPEALALGQDYPAKVAAFGGYVVWANDGSDCQGNPVSTVMRVGAGGSPEVVQAGVTCPSNFVASGASLYWGAGNAIYRMVIQP